jgi:hypothetical protein
MTTLTRDPIEIAKAFRADQRAEDDAIRQHGLRMELHFSSGAPRWFIFAGDMVLGQYNHKALAALHLIAEGRA